MFIHHLILTLHHLTMSSKYRGAVVEVSFPPSSSIAPLTNLQDLQLAPAFCLPATASLSQALEAAYEREFDQLP